MPIYSLNGKTYNIPDDLAERFEKENPNSTVSVSGGGKNYNIPASKRDAFFRSFGDAAYVGAQPKSAEQSTGAQPNTAAQQMSQGQQSQPVQAPQGGGEDGNEFTAQQLDNMGKEPEKPAFEPTSGKMPVFWDHVNEDGSLKRDAVLESETVMGDDLNFVRKPKLVQGADGTSVYRDMQGNEYDPLSEEGMRLADANTMQVEQSVKKAKMEQVAQLSSDIDKAFADYQKQHVSALSYGTYYGGAAGMNATKDQAFNNYSAARNSVRNAQDIIEEANKSVKEGNFEGFVKGTFRGLGNKFFDVKNWDMGMTDAVDNSALYKALQKADSNEPLTQDEQMLLDAKAVELATQAYFGSYIGRGYKMGQVTAESLPFMLEMCINPAAAAGETAQSMMVRYALKRYGKEAVKNNAKKFAASKIGARVAGDLAGASLMSATTGAARTVADTYTRMGGDVQFGESGDGTNYYDGHTDGESLGMALGHAFAATTIENYSEMVGEYFAPVLGVAGKGLSKGLEKIGLNGVNEFVEGVAMSDVAKLVSDFEKQTKWNGTFGEFAEEIVGGVMNALIVGDQTLDMAENTGVFNKDNLIDTFLGVSLMGGFMSAVKTVGYRGPKYQAQRELNNADYVGAAQFSDPERWENIKKSVAAGEDGMKEVLRGVNLSDVLSIDQKQAIINYINKVQKLDGLMRGEQKRRKEEGASAQADAETSFDNGYSLDSQDEMNDAKNNYDLRREAASLVLGEQDMAELDGDDPVGTLAAINFNEIYSPEQKQAALDYLNAKATYDGMLQKVGDTIDDQVAQSDAMIDSHVARTGTNQGMIVPATLKEGDKKVYVLDGDVVMFDDDTMVDVSKSSESVLVVDEDGKMQFVGPRDVLRVEKPIDAARQKQEARQAIEQMVAEEAARKIEGALSFAPGDKYSVSFDDGVHEVDVVQDNGDGTVAVVIDGATQQVMSKDELQQRSDAASMARAMDYGLQKEQEAQAEQEPAADATGTVAEAPVADMPAADATGTVAEAPAANAEGTVVAEPMPMVGETEEPDFMAATPERGADYLMNESGLSMDDALAFADANLTEAKKEGEKLKKKRPKPSTNLGKYKQELSEWENNVTTAGERESHWKILHDRIAAQIRENKLRDRELEQQRQDAERAAAEQDEAAYRAEQERLAAEQEARGANNVAQEIIDKWNSAKKVEGNRDQITLPNGKVITGTHYMVEADAITPSHDATNGFQPTVGFPVNETGENVNTRDYYRDKDAQTFTNNVSADFDERGLGVVVSKDAGIPYSGNGRTIAGQLAAANGTDGKYIEYLANYGQKFGYTAEQVGEFEHPRDVFVPDEQLPYTSEVFDMFNQQEMKGQSKTEQAVKLGKVVDDATFGRIVNIINRFDKINDFYNDNKAATDAMSELQHAGVVTQAQVAEMFDGEGVSAIGKDLLENVLVGKAFEKNPDAVRMISKFRSMRQSIVMALSEIANNIKLGNAYSLENELAAAIGLVYKARSEGGYKAGDRVSGYAKQTVLGFADETGDTVADATNLTVMQIADRLNDKETSGLRKYMQNYNSNAQLSAAGQLDLFADGVLTKEDIINQAKEVINNGTEQEAAGAASAEEAGTIDNGGEAGEQVTEDTGANAPRKEAKTSLLDVVRDLYTKGKEYAAKLYNRSFFDVVETPSFMKDLGLRGDKFTIRYGVISRHLGKDEEHDLPESVWEKLPEALQNPFAITKYFADENKQQQKGYRIFTTIQLDNGSFVVVSAEVKNTGRDIEVNAINTVFGRNSISDVHDELIYRADKITPEQQALLDGNNPHQYPDGREVKRDVSEREDSNNIANGQNTAVENAEIGSNEGETEGADDKNALERAAQIEAIQRDEAFGADDNIEANGIALLKAKLGLRVKYGKKWTGTEGTAKSTIAGQIYFTLQDNLRGVKDSAGIEIAEEYHIAVIPVLKKRLIETYPALEPEITESLDYALGEWEKAVERARKAVEDGNKYDAKLLETLAAIKAAEAETDTNPSEAQKEAGNYKKGHVKVDGYDITIENPKGSERSGKDADGKEWSVTMNNTYGYIRGTEGVDGDHIDVFLSDNPEQGNVYVVDQVKADGSFDEHKVMYGFGSAEEAREAYLANYSEGWTGLGTITEVSKEEFKKWIESSHRKTKPFSEYKSVKKEGAQGEEPKSAGDKIVREEDLDFLDGMKESNRKEFMAECVSAFNSANLKVPAFQLGVPENEQETMTFEKFRDEYVDKNGEYLTKSVEKYLRPAYEYISRRLEEMSSNKRQQPKSAAGEAYTITDASYTNKKGKTSEMKLVKFDALTDEQKKAAKQMAREMKGWYSREDNGFMMRSEEDAQKLVEQVMNGNVADAQPVSLADVKDAAEQPNTAADEQKSADEAVAESNEPAVKEEPKTAPASKYEPGSRVFYKNMEFEVESVNADGTLNLKGEHMKMGVNPMGIDPMEVREPGSLASFDFYYNEFVKYIAEKKITVPFAQKVLDGVEREIDKLKAKMDGAEAPTAVQGEELARLLGMRKALVERIEGKQEAETATYHAGDTVFSKKHAANKTIFVASHAGGKVTYTFTDGTKANQDEVEDRLPEPEELNSAETQTAESADAPAVEEKPAEPKRLVSDARMEELKAKLRKKMGGQLNVGVDPEMLALGAELAVGYIERGLTKFADYAKVMVEDLGDLAKPYLKAFYNAVRDMPEAEDYADQMDSYDDVRKFDVANMGQATVNAMAVAEQVTNEQQAEADAQQAMNTIKETRNNNRNETEKQIAAGTETVAREAATVAGEAERVAKTGSAEQLNEQLTAIDAELEKVNTQLALLGYYEADTSDPSQFNEMYGYMRTAEKKAVADANKLAKRIADMLGAEVGKKIAKANIAPIGGDIYFRIPLTLDRELYVDMIVDNDHDNILLRRTMFRIEDPTKSSPRGQFITSNEFFYPEDEIDSVLSAIRRAVEWGAPDFEITPKEQTVKKPSTKKNNGEKKANGTKNDVSLQQQGDLFAGMFEEEQPSTAAEAENEEPKSATMGDLFAQKEEVTTNNDNNNGSERTDELRTEGLPANGSNQGEPTERLGQENREEVRGSDRGGQEEGSRGLGQRMQPAGRLDGELNGPAKNTNNNHAARGKDYAPKGVDARIEANIKAIELMQSLMESGKKATKADMKVLRQFSGWGGLGKAFNEHPNGPWSSNPITAQLKQLLGDEAYEQANMSRNSAYFTPAAVIDTLWDVARALGFKGGNVLEGSAGIGNIIGAMPTDMSERSDIHAVEIDGTTGNILSLLYPDANVEVQGFEETKIQNGTVDLAITNVPFVTGLRVMDSTGDGDLSKKFHDIHDFCIAKNIRKLREGGIGIFITSNGTLDNSQKLRSWITTDGKADVVGAFRLNNETFGGTGATSDIIVVRKRVSGKKSNNAIDVSMTSAERTATYDTGEVKKKKGVEEPVIKQLSMDYNKYFIEHPEYMAGEMKWGFEKGDTFRPTSKALYPVRGKNQNEMLAAWLKTFENMEEDTNVTTDGEASGTGAMYENLGENVKEGSMLIDSNGKLCVAQYGKAVPLAVNANKVKGQTKEQCFRDYADIKQAVAEVLEYQTNNESDEGLKQVLAKLNKAYDAFVAKYGRLNRNTAISFLKNDVDWPSIVALEKVKEKVDANGNKSIVIEKTDIFNTRVVSVEREPEPKNVKDGIIASLYQFGRIDVPYLSDKLGKSEDEVREEIIESGLGFENPQTAQMEVSYEYLMGNVREKLRQAQEANTDGKYNANVKALEKVIPMDIPAHSIEFTLGSSWIEPKLFEDYVKDKTGIPVRFTRAGGTWLSSEQTYSLGTEQNKSLGVYSQILDDYVLGHEIIVAAMQNKSIEVSKTYKNSDGTTETVKDKDATQAVSTKIDEVRQDFKEWARQRMQQDSEMAKKMEKVYNDTFNNYVPMSVPDEFVPEYFGGANHKFKMRPHQARAIVRGTMQPLLLAHEVGTGKTFTLISTAMEMRRLGTAKKPMVVVQNATVGQFVSSAKELYPNAKILTIEDTDKTPEGRRNFYAKIKYNDWDMIVVPQSVLERIPDSEERQMAYIQEKIAEKMDVLDAIRNASDSGNDWAVKQAERELEKLQEELDQVGSVAATKRNKKKDEKKEAITKQNAEVRAREMLERSVDDVENFDEMGIDALLVDEAHEYKHLGFATAMQRGVKGVDPSYSKKAQGVFLKTQAVLEKSNGKNVVFATGTPISNTAAEIWTFMRYLMPADTMKEYGIYYFDDFVRNFGNLQTMLEFTTSGTFKENNRFAGYVNLPELVRIWSGVADTMLTKDAEGVSDKIPAMEKGKAQDIYLPQTHALRSVMKYVKAELKRYENMTGKEKKENSHIPLTMFGIAKAAAVDARLVVADAADEPQSKTNEAVRQTMKALKDTARYKGTVALFADNYQNKHSGFNLYEDIREKLIEQGVPAEQIVVMKSGMSIKKKLEIFDKVNNGDIRVIMGSTFTLGTGVNIQERLHTVIHLDAPNRPMDYTQRNGRILRQGNIHKDMGLPVRVLRFGVEDSLDVTAYQRLKTKGAIADSIMNGKTLMQNSMDVRTMEEEEDVFGDTVAQLSGSEYAMLKNQAEKDVRKYEGKYKQWRADQTYIHNAIPQYEQSIETAVENAQWSREMSKKVVEGFGTKTPTITIGKQTFKDLVSMADFFKEYNKKLKEDEDDLRKSYMMGTRQRTTEVKAGGFTFVVVSTLTKENDVKNGSLQTVIRRKTTYTCNELNLSQTAKGGYLKDAITEILNLAANGEKEYQDQAERFDNNAERLRSELAMIREREGKPFQYEKELDEARAHLEEYSELMKNELAEKEKKYEEMDSEVGEAVNVENAEEDEEDSSDDDKRFRDGGQQPNTATAEDKDLRYSLREQMPPKKTKKAYAVFIVKREKQGNVTLHPKMLADESVGAPPLTWLNADTGTIKKDADGNPLQNTRGRVSVRDAKGAPLAWRPGKHLAPYPNASQFAVESGTKGVRDRLPDDVVFFEVEYAADRNYQLEAWEYGVNGNGKYEHSQAGLPYIPKDGYYIYRTNANPDIPAMIITGAYRITRALTDEEAKKLNQDAGGDWYERKGGKPITAERLKELGLDKEGLQAKAESFDYEALDPHYDESAVAMSMPGYVRRDLDFDDKNLQKAIEENKRAGGMELDHYKYMYEKDKANERQREMSAFEENQVLPITADTDDWGYTLGYTVEGVTAPYPSKERLLDAFREKHAGYVAHLTSDGNGIVVNSWRKVLEKLRTPKRKSVASDADYVDRKTRNVVGFIEKKAKKLGLKVKVLTSTEGLTGRRARAKGWYDTRTGEIVIVLPNHTSGPDVMCTLLHEGVGHYGLRELLGEDFDTFLDNVYQNADEPIRRRITEMAAKNGWDFRVATEEYLAMLAEDMDFERNLDQNWWQQIKFMFLDMLRKAGIVLNERLTDNDMRYLLWKSYENLAYAGEHGIVRAARVEVMKQELGVGNYGTSANALGTVADENGPDDDPSPSGGGGGRRGRTSGELRYRDGGRMDERDHTIVSDHYERQMRSSLYQFQEAMQDSMLSLKRLMETVAKRSGKKVMDYENAYLAENALSSRNHAEQEVYGRQLFNPMLDEVHRLAKENSSRDEVTRYMMAKHGLERQTYMESRAIQQAQADGNEEPEQRDYAGLTGLMGTDDIAEAIRLAEEMVADFENEHDTDELWARVNACTKATLEKTYKSGLLSKEGYENILKMYQWYIPLRGFDETTSEEVYAYLTHERSSFNAPIKKAEGRSSVANDPLATIANMADSAIAQGNKNLMKQRFLKFAMNHPTDLLSVNRMWLKLNDVTGQWEAVTADLKEDDTPDEVRQKTEAFEEQMSQLAESDPDHYKRGRDAANIPYRALGKDLNEHMVQVKVGGEDYIITVNGNPRVAQAVNGLTNPDTDADNAVGAILKAGEKVNRQMSAFYTTRNPEFVLSNFLRDALYANTTMWVRESPNYAAKFNANFLKHGYKLFGLMRKFDAGKLDRTNPIEEAFYQFMMNGGETGYTVVRNVDIHKELIKRYMKGKDQKIPVRLALRLLGDKLDEINRAVENMARFAAFMTSREMGRTVERSVVDAKEVSVNFNKKGAGSKFMGKTGQTKLGSTAAFASGLGRSFYVFWNAAIQGTTNFGRLHKQRPAQAIAMDASLFLLGSVLAYYGGGDDDDYWNLPEYVRRSNICFKIPGTHNFVKIPLGIEQRAVYGLGELFSSVASGKERKNGGEIAKEIAASMSSLLPLDMMEGNGELNASALVPSYVKPVTEAALNKDWKGMPIYKDTPWNKDDPEWTKATTRTNHYMVEAAKMLNEMTGGDEVVPGYVDLNPAQIEHVLEGTFGGVASTINKLGKMYDTAVTGKQEFDWRNMLMASRVVQGSDENAAARKINSQYWKYYDEYKETKRRVTQYTHQEQEGIEGAAEKIDFLYYSERYGRYNIMEPYVEMVKNLNDALKETVDPADRKDLEQTLTDIKSEMLSEIWQYEDSINNK